MTKTILNLHVITDDLNVIEQSCAAGADWIQLRIKDKPLEEIEETALATWDICNSYGATFILNDHVKLAQKIKAHGVHLGKNDMHPAKAREVLGPNFIIGGTANTLEDMLWCTTEGCDYIGLGPYRFTETKKELAPILGECHMVDLIEAYSIKAQNPLPVIAIGGIRQDDVKTIIEMGHNGVAVSSAIAKADDVQQATKEFLQLLPSLEGLGVGKSRERREILPYNPKLKERARELRNNSTLSEILLWKKLKGKQMRGFDFDRQRPIDNYIVDFYCKDLTLAIEIDGSSHDHKFLYDSKRNQKLESLGVTVLHFTDKEVKQDMSNVLRTIDIWIEETGVVPFGTIEPTPKSPPKRGPKTQLQ